MAIDNDDVISTLNGLIETSKDGQKGYKDCADGTKDPELKLVFEEGAQSCARAAAELQDCVRKLGGDPDEGGSVSGALHRGWANIKAALTGKDPRAILSECERGEDAAKASYRKALEQELPGNIREIVDRQYQGVLRNHDRVRALRDTYTASP